MFFWKRSCSRYCGWTLFPVEWEHILKYWVCTNEQLQHLPSVVDRWTCLECIKLTPQLLTRWSVPTCTPVVLLLLQCRQRCFLWSCLLGLTSQFSIGGTSCTRAASACTHHVTSKYVHHQPQGSLSFLLSLLYKPQHGLLPGVQTLYHRMCYYWINGKGLLKSALTNDNMIFMHYCSSSYLSLCRCCPFCRRCFPLWRPLRWPWSSAPCGGRAGRLWAGPSSTWERWTWWVWQDTAKKIQDNGDPNRISSERRTSNYKHVRSVTSVFMLMSFAA